MHDMDILRELIREQARVPVKNHNGENTVKLKEPGNGQQKGYAIEIKDIPDGTIVINLDKNFKEQDKIFGRTQRGILRRADFVLFANEADDNWIVYIEMKRSKFDEEDICQQLKGAKCFVIYCRAIGKIFWEQESFLQNWKERFVGIVCTNLNTTATRPPKPNSDSCDEDEHDKPENMLRISAPEGSELLFRKLVGKPLGCAGPEADSLDRSLQLSELANPDGLHPNFPVHEAARNGIL